MAVEMPVLTEQIADCYATHRAPLLAWLARLVGAIEAEDLCQDLFLRLLAGGIPAGSSDDVAAWLASEALRLARASRRRRAHEYRAGMLSSPAQAGEDSSATLGPLHAPAALALFSEEERQLLARIPGDARQADIAEALGCSAGALRTRLYRLRLRHRDTAPQDVAARAGAGAGVQAEALRRRRAAARRQNVFDREAKQ